MTRLHAERALEKQVTPVLPGAPPGKSNCRTLRTVRTDKSSPYPLLGDSQFPRPANLFGNNPHALPCRGVESLSFRSLVPPKPQTFFTRKFDA
jgi:hypothetical protein